MIGFVLVLTMVLDLIVCFAFAFILKYGKHHRPYELYALFTSLMFLLMMSLVVNGLTNIIK